LIITYSSPSCKRRHTPESLAPRRQAKSPLDRARLRRLVG
jgi:hypothetical protein